MHEAAPHRTGRLLCRVPRMQCCGHTCTRACPHVCTGAHTPVHTHMPTGTHEHMHAHAHTHAHARPSRLVTPAQSRPAVQDASCRWAWHQQHRQRLAERALQPGQQEETKPKSPATSPQALRGEVAARSWDRPAKVWGAMFLRAVQGGPGDASSALKPTARRLRQRRPAGGPGTRLHGRPLPSLSYLGAGGPTESAGTCK